MRYVYNKKMLQLYCEAIMDCLKTATIEGRTGVPNSDFQSLSLEQICNDISYNFPDIALTRRIIFWMIRKRLLRYSTQGPNGSLSWAGYCYDESFTYTKGHPLQGKPAVTIKINKFNDWTGFNFENRFFVFIKTYGPLLTGGVGGAICSMIFRH